MNERFFVARPLIPSAGIFPYDTQMKSEGCLTRLVARVWGINAAAPVDPCFSLFPATSLSSFLDLHNGIHQPTGESAISAAWPGTHAELSACIPTAEPDPAKLEIDKPHENARNWQLRLVKKKKKTEDFTPSFLPLVISCKRSPALNLFVAFAYQILRAMKRCQRIRTKPIAVCISRCRP